MPNIPESYASPLLRWALMLEDWPNATHTFDVVRGDVLGIPERFGGKSEFLRCVIRFGKGNQATAIGWKPLDGAKQNPDEYNVLCTKSLGRALKRAGYPDSLPDLKAMVVWRTRKAEIAQIAGATAAGALGAGESVEHALEAASVADPDDLGHDDTPEEPVMHRVLGERLTEEAVLVDVETGEIIEATMEGEVAEAMEEITTQYAPQAETMEMLRQAVTDSAKTNTQKALRAWAKDQRWSVTDPPTEAAALMLIAKANELAEAPL